MNTINFAKNDFPLVTNVLGFMQDAANLVEKLCGIISGNYIISGCELIGGAVNSGYVVVSGEIMPFAGGAVQTYVRVVSTPVTVPVQDANYTKTTKQLIFGAGTGQIAWSTFRRASDVIENPTISLSGLTGSAGLHRKIIEIGDWNMVTTPNKQVFDDTVLFTSVRSAQVSIRSDGTNYMTDIFYAGSFQAYPGPGGPVAFLLNRTAGGSFTQGDLYNETPYNRGWILIDYIP